MLHYQAQKHVDQIFNDLTKMENPHLIGTFKIIHNKRFEECYIFDETDKDDKNKLLFNLTKKTHPFISIIPENSPYLCYEKN